MACTVDGSALMPSAETTWPWYVMRDLANPRFSKLSVTPLSSRRRKTGLTIASCSSDDSPNIMVSSIMHSTPGRSSSTLCILLWKCLGADVIPNGKRRKQHLPKGVMKIVSSQDDGARGICRYPELASRFVNTFTPVSRPSIWSTYGKSCFSLMTLSLNFVRFTHIRTLCVSFTSPLTVEETTLGLATSTIPAHQSVGVAINSPDHLKILRPL